MELSRCNSQDKQTGIGVRIYFQQFLPFPFPVWPYSLDGRALRGTKTTPKFKIFRGCCCVLCFLFPSVSGPFLWHPENFLDFVFWGRVENFYWFKKKCFLGNSWGFGLPVTAEFGNERISPWQLWNLFFCYQQDFHLLYLELMGYFSKQDYSINQIYRLAHWSQGCRAGDRC